MANQISIYLAGKIQKAHEKPNEHYWTKKDLKDIENLLSSYQVCIS